MKERNRDSYFIDVKEYGTGIKLKNKKEIEIFFKVMNDLCINPDDDEDIIVECSSTEFQNFIARIITQTLKI